MKNLFVVLMFFFLINWQTFSHTVEVPKPAISIGNDGNAIPGNSVFANNANSGTGSGLVRISKKNHVHKLNVTNKPCTSVPDGTRLVFECWDALEGRSKEYFENKTPHSKIFPNANPATGPIFIEGAMPGDVLEIEIHDIRLSSSGFINLHKFNFFDSDKQETVHVENSIVGDQMFYNGRNMPVESMVGVIGTGGFEEIYTQEVGDNGGNMDTRIIKKGSKVLLPVSVEGALLAIGDVHAVMGDGEVNGMGLEIGAEVEVTVRVRKDLKIQRPMIINADRIACIDSDPDILTAKNQVLKDMGKYLVDVCGFSSTDACALMSFYGNLRFCQIVNPQKTVRMEIEKQYMELFEYKTLPF